MKERIIEALTFEATKDIWRGNFGSKEFKICDQLNYELFGKHFNRRKRCECIEDFFLLLKSRLKKLNFKSIQMDKKFKLKKGRLVQNHAFPYGVSEFSSDAECLKLLKLNPANIKHFESVPKGWESMTLGDESGADWTKLTIAKIKALALENGCEIEATVKAEVIEEYKLFLENQKNDETDTDTDANADVDTDTDAVVDTDADADVVDVTDTDIIQD
jgi:hypothetical protein